jgi:DNA-binding PucR family transcriptional regulator
MAFEQLGIERILSLVPDLSELTDYVDSVLGPIILHDRSHGTALIATLHSYLASSRRQRATAQMLGIHVNSLNYRLRRIEEVGHLCLDDADTCLNLHVAVRIQQMLNPA